MHLRSIRELPNDNAFIHAIVFHPIFVTRVSHCALSIFNLTTEKRWSELHERKRCVQSRKRPRRFFYGVQCDQAPSFSLQINGQESLRS